MALQDQMNSRNALRDLKANPLNALQQYRLQVGLQPGHQTQVSRVPFALNHGSITIGPGAPNSDCRVYINAMVTPTRGRNSPNRFTGLQRFNSANADFWITERQTGCSLVILDWGGGQMSMAHLEPHAFNSYNRVSQYLMNRSPLFVFAEMQRQNLKPEVTRVVDASKVGNVNPRNYIFVQSNHAPINIRNINVVGVSNGGPMNFYMQTNAATTTVQQLQWTNWSSYKPYYTY